MSVLALCVLFIASVHTNTISIHLQKAILKNEHLHLHLKTICLGAIL